MVFLSDSTAWEFTWILFPMMVGKVPGHHFDIKSFISKAQGRGQRQACMDLEVGVEKKP